MSDRTFNVNITGGNNQNAFGDNSHFEMTVEGGGKIDLDELFRGIANEIPEADREKVTEEVVKPLREIAGEKEPESDEEKTSLKERILAIANKLEPYTPYIRKTVAAFAEGALKTIPPPASWVVGGCLEVVRQERKD